MSLRNVPRLEGLLSWRGASVHQHHCDPHLISVAAYSARPILAEVTQAYHGPLPDLLLYPFLIALALGNLHVPETQTGEILMRTIVRRTQRHGPLTKE